MKKYGLLVAAGLVFGMVACDVDVSETGSSMASKNFMEAAPQMTTVYQHPEFGLHGDEGANSKMFEGEVVKAFATGNGAELGVQLKGEKGQEFQFNVNGPKAGDFPAGTHLNIRYKVKQDTLITGVRLATEDIETAVAGLSAEDGYQAAVKTNMEDAEFTINAMYSNGSKSDMGKFLAVQRTGEAKPKMFNAAFDSDVDNLERYKDQEVVLYGVVETKIDGSSCRTLKEA
ncbi:MAG: hypothetical protein GY810_21730 [Aureispira sp.]|nr:hypothetical protein [Aureispira sp.]